MGLDDTFEAFCFDEACAYILTEYGKRCDDETEDDIPWQEQFEINTKPTNNAELFAELGLDS